MAETPLGSDQYLNETIKDILATSGFETNDPEVLKLVEWAMRQKIYDIARNIDFMSKQGDEETQTKLEFSDLTSALLKITKPIQIDRPDFIQENVITKSSSSSKRKK